MEVCLSCLLCFQLEVSAKGRSLVQRCSTDCGVSECDQEDLIMGRPWPTGGFWATGRGEGGWEVLLTG